MINAVYISLTIFFVNYCFSPGGIFGFVGEYFEGPRSCKFEKFLAKPLFTCVVCMAPYYTWFILKFVDGYNIPGKLLTIGVVGGINVILSSIIGFLNTYHGQGLEGDTD